MLGSLSKNSSPGHFEIIEEIELGADSKATGIFMALNTFASLGVPDPVCEERVSGL